jgi:hypothetical protein
VDRRGPGRRRGENVGPEMREGVGGEYLNSESRVGPSALPPGVVNHISQGYRWGSYRVARVALDSQFAAFARVVVVVRSNRACAARVAHGVNVLR